MNAFDMISEPAFFAEHLGEHSHRVHQSVELIPALADALLAQDFEKMKALHEQISRSAEEVNQSKLSLYDQIRNMHFYRVGGYAFNQYLNCQDKVASSAQEFADLLVSRRMAVPTELHADFRAFVTQVVSVSQRTRHLAEGLSSETPTVGPDTGVQGTLAALQGVRDDYGQARRLEMEFSRHLYSLEKPPDLVTIMFLDRCCTALREVADNTAQTANQLRLMIHWP